jgi:hypothetical protein
MFSTRGRIATEVECHISTVGMFAESLKHFTDAILDSNCVGYDLIPWSGLVTVRPVLTLQLNRTSHIFLQAEILSCHDVVKRRDILSYKAKWVIIRSFNRVVVCHFWHNVAYCAVLFPPVRCYSIVSWISGGSDGGLIAKVRYESVDRSWCILQRLQDVLGPGKILWNLSLLG